MFFSQLGKAASQALYQWDDDRDAQFGKVDDSSRQQALERLGGYWLGQMYRQGPAAPEIPALIVTDTATVERLARKNSDGAFLVMLAAHAVLTPAPKLGVTLLATA